MRAIALISLLALVAATAATALEVTVTWSPPKVYAYPRPPTSPSRAAWWPPSPATRP
jgi:hypothetical protein